MKALIATDGTPGALEAAHQSLALLHPGLEIQIVSVVPPLEDPMETAGGFEGSLLTEDEAQHDYDDAKSAATHAVDATKAVVDTTATTEIVEGSDPGRTICDLAEQRQVDVLVVGASTKGWFARLLNGSVMEYAAHHAPCAVLIVRHHD